MNRLKIRHLIVSALLATAASASQASIVWDWSFGSNSGEFITTGTAVGGTASAGSYQVTDFEVTSSGSGATIGSVSGGQYSASGFATSEPYAIVWNGSDVTSWTQSGTNTFDWLVFSDLSNSNDFFFGWQTGDINTAMQADFFPESTTSSALSIEVAGGSSVPEPGSVALFALGIAAAALAMRRAKV